MTASRRTIAADEHYGSPTVTVDLPGDTGDGAPEENDVLLVQLLTNDGWRSLTELPTGFALIASATTTTSPGAGWWLLKKKLGASEPASYDFTFNFEWNGRSQSAVYKDGSDVSVYGSAAFSDIDAASPYDINAGAIMVPDADSKLVFFAGFRHATTGTDSAFTKPSGFANESDSATSIDNRALFTCDKTQASAGTSGAAAGSVANATGGNGRTVGVLVAIAPVGGTSAITSSGEDELPVITAVVLDESAITTTAGNTSDQVVTVKDQGGVGLPYLTGMAASSNEAVATVAQLAATDANGQATVRITTLAAGTATISIAFDGVSDSIALTVVSAGQSARSISPASVTLAPGETQQFVAYADGEQSSHVWSVPVGGGTITPSGLYTAPTGVGTATVRASDPLDSAQYVEATVTIAEAAATGTATVAWPGAANLTLDCFVFDKNDDFVGKFSATFDASGAADLRVPVAYIGERVQVFANNLGSDMSTAGKVHGQKVVVVT